MTIDSSIFKAYDIRGIYSENIDEDLAYKIGLAYAFYVHPKGKVAVGRDVRVHSMDLQKKVVEGLMDSGVDVLDIGLITTDMYYFAVGKYNLAGGIQVTASHNPPEWHGFKFVRENVIPLTLEAGVGQIRDLVIKNNFKKSQKKGTVERKNIEDDYCNYVLGWLHGTRVKPFKVITNPNFGYAGKIFEKIVKKGNLPLKIISINGEPDGTFPKGRPDPFVPENRIEFVDLVKSSGSDFGVTWDADADRAFFCADGGVFIEPYYLGTILIKHLLKKFPGAKVIYDPRYTWALIDTIEKNGGRAIPIRVGHSYIKEGLRKNDALLGIESSGHTYYRDYWYADSGMLPVMQILEFLSESNIKLSQAAAPVMEKYPISGEINSEVKDQNRKMEEISKKYKDGKQSRLDGISVEYSNYRFTVRPSNTEPLLRLTLEAKTKELMEQKRDEVLALIRS